MLAIETDEYVTNGRTMYSNDELDEDNVMIEDIGNDISQDDQRLS